MRRILFFFLICCMISCGTSKHVESEMTSHVSYEGLAVDGSYMVNVVGYGHSTEDVIKRAKAEAVRSVLFDGLEPAKKGLPRQNPMVPDSVANQKSDFFSIFFKNGTYEKFTCLTPGRPPIIIREGKMYKSTVSITVYKDALRKELESKKIIKSLSTVF